MHETICRRLPNRRSTHRTGGAHLRAGDGRCRSDRAIVEAGAQIGGASMPAACLCSGGWMEPSSRAGDRGGERSEPQW